MNNLFLVFTALSALTVSVLFILGYFTFLNKKITWQRWLFIVLGMLLLTNFIILFNKGNEVNNQLTNRIANNGKFNSVISVNDSDKITDAKLYRYLEISRTPHAKIIFAQAKHESQSYTSSLFKRANNLFGMTVPTSRSTCGFEETGEFQSYTTWKLSVTDYIIYSLSQHIDKLSDAEYLNFLGTGKYAKDPNYREKIMKTINSIDFKKLENN